VKYTSIHREKITTTQRHNYSHITIITTQKHKYSYTNNFKV